MIDWFFATLKQYPEIAIFLTLAFGYYFGKFTFKGIGLGSVTATLLAGVLIGQIGITISQPLKAIVFLMFLFAVGYAVGPQFVRGIAKDGLPQAIFSVVQCVFSLVGRRRDRQDRRLRSRLRGRPLLGVADDFRRDGPVDRRHQPAGPARRPGQGPDRLDAGRLRRDLHVRHDRLGDRHRRPRPEAARHRSRRRVQGLRGEARRRQQGNRRRRLGLAPLGNARLSGCSRAARPSACAPSRPRRCVPDARVFVLRIRRNGKIEEATADTVLQRGRRRRGRRARAKCS